MKKPMVLLCLLILPMAFGLAGYAAKPNAEDDILVRLVKSALSPMTFMPSFLDDAAIEVVSSGSERDVLDKDALVAFFKQSREASTQGDITDFKLISLTKNQRYASIVYTAQFMVRHGDQTTRRRIEANEIWELQPIGWTKLFGAVDLR